ncbi:unnamed protein product [Miscanthus lutarioriparius]|uniref:Uncharacterized protein n=1 Tax=Miscanthus lutarioriparius TaxID=422564 RepID=A0A811S6M6_9POAL|nr:unnamed protein product [Miscanthus lutarioriparius]
MCPQLELPNDQRRAVEHSSSSLWQPVEGQQQGRDPPWACTGVASSVIVAVRTGATSSAAAAARSSAASSTAIADHTEAASSAADAACARAASTPSLRKLSVWQRRGRAGLGRIHRRRGRAKRDLDYGWREGQVTRRVCVTGGVRARVLTGIYLRPSAPSTSISI